MSADLEGAPARGAEVQPRAVSLQATESLPGSSIHEIFQARILEWVAISFSRGSSQPRALPGLSCIGRWILLLPGKPYETTSYTKDFIHILSTDVLFWSQFPNHVAFRCHVSFISSGL